MIFSLVPILLKNKYTMYIRECLQGVFFFSLYSSCVVSVCWLAIFPTYAPSLPVAIVSTYTPMLISSLLRTNLEWPFSCLSSA